MMTFKVIRIFVLFFKFSIWTSERQRSSHIRVSELVIFFSKIPKTWFLIIYKSNSFLRLLIEPLTSKLTGLALLGWYTKFLKIDLKKAPPIDSSDYCALYNSGTTNLQAISDTRNLPNYKEFAKACCSQIKITGSAVADGIYTRQDEYKADENEAARAELHNGKVIYANGTNLLYWERKT